MTTKVDRINADWGYPFHRPLQGEPGSATHDKIKHSVPFLPFIADGIHAHRHGDKWRHSFRKKRRGLKVRAVLCTTILGIVPVMILDGIATFVLRPLARHRTNAQESEEIVSLEVSEDAYSSSYSGLYDFTEYGSFSSSASDTDSDTFETAIL